MLTTHHGSAGPRRRSRSDAAFRNAFLSAMAHAGLDERRALKLIRKVSTATLFDDNGAQTGARRPHR